MVSHGIIELFFCETLLLVFVVDVLVEAAQSIKIIIFTIVSGHELHLSVHAYVLVLLITVCCVSTAVYFTITFVIVWRERVRPYLECKFTNAAFLLCEHCPCLAPAVMLADLHFTPQLERLVSITTAAQQNEIGAMYQSVNRYLRAAFLTEKLVCAKVKELIIFCYLVARHV